MRWHRRKTAQYFWLIMMTICVCLRAVAMPHDMFVPVSMASIGAISAGVDARQSRAIDESACVDHRGETHPQSGSQTGTNCQIQCAQTSAPMLIPALVVLSRIGSDVRYPEHSLPLFGIVLAPALRPPIA